MSTDEPTGPNPEEPPPPVPPTGPGGWGAPAPPPPPPPQEGWGPAQPPPPPPPEGWGPPGAPPYGGQAPYTPPPYGPVYGGAPTPPAPQYAYGAYGYQAAETESLAVVALVLAIGSWVVCPIIPAVVALVLAGKADEYIRASGGRKQGEGMSKAARVVAWVNIGFTTLLIVCGIIVAFFVAIASD